MICAFILWGLLEERLLLLHDAEPLVLIDDHVLDLNLRIRSDSFKEMHLFVELAHLVDARGNLLVVLLFSSFQDSS